MNESCHELRREAEAEDEAERPWWDVCNEVPEEDTAARDKRVRLEQKQLRFSKKKMSQI